jgi:hypothetical protein
MIRRKQQAEKEKTALAKRIEQISTKELLQWVDSTMFGIGRNLADWDRSAEFVYLEESKIAAEALLEVITEIENRNKGTRNF